MEGCGGGSVTRGHCKQVGVIATLLARRDRRGPFTGLAAQRFRPAVDGGWLGGEVGLAPPFTGFLDVWLSALGPRLKPNTRRPVNGPRRAASARQPAVNGGPTPLRGKPRKRGCEKIVAFSER